MMTSSPPVDREPSRNDILTRAFGGPLGIVESVTPGLAFVFAQTLTQDVRVAALWTAIPIVVFVGIRATRRLRGRRTPWSSIFTGVFGAAIGLVLALTTRNATTNYLPGIFINSVVLLFFLVSVVVRWPWVGLVIGVWHRDVSGWREYRALLAACTWATWVWCAGTALRVGVMTTLYIEAQATQSVVALGVAKLALGSPVLACELAATWLIVRPAYVEWRTPAPEPTERAAGKSSGVPASARVRQG